MKKIAITSAVCLAIIIGAAVAISSSYANVSGAAPAKVNPDIAGWWTFNDGSGCAVKDTSQYGINGTLKPSCPGNSPNWTTGKQGTALKFDGTNDYVNLTFDKGLNFSQYSKFSVEVWFNTTDTTLGDQIILQKGQNGHEQVLLDIAGKKLRFRITNSATQIYDAKDTANLISNRWFHVVGVFNGTSVLVYKNATLVDTKTTTGTLISTTLSLTAGITSDASGGKYLQGMIDNVRIWGRALTSSEVAALYARAGS